MTNVLLSILALTLFIAIVFLLFSAIFTACDIKETLNEKDEL